MKKVCWAVQWRTSLVADPADLSSPVRTLLFRSRKHAQAWIEDNPYWQRLQVKPVKVKVTITEV